MAELQLSVGQKIGNYRIERVLGRGRMGIVYLARDEALLRLTAIKVLSWQFPEGPGLSPESWFLSEARSVARINHGNVIHIYAVARHGGTCYIAMEFLEGGSTEQWVQKHGPFSPRRATEILMDVASALQAAHDADIIHRDIKPENILLDGGGRAKLGDFGMALRTTDASAQNGGRAGTPYYTAPELWKNRPATRASDIYSLGASFFHLMTGRPPFVASDLQGIAAAHLNQEPPALESLISGAPRAIAELVRKSLAKEPQARFGSAAELAQAARLALEPPPAPPPAPPAPPSSTAHNPRVQPPRLNTPSGPPTEAPPWGGAFGLTRSPFGAVAAEDLPYLGSPVREVLVRLKLALSSGKPSRIVLRGLRGSGRSMLLRRLQSELGPSAVSLSPRGGDDSPIELAEQLFIAGRQLQTLNQPHLLCLDEALADSSSLETDLGKLLSTLVLPSKLSVLFTATLEDGDTPPPSQSFEGWVSASLPSLTLSQGLDYIDRWLAYGAASKSPPLLLTPDAKLLVVSCGEGVPKRMNRVVSLMLRWGASRGARLLSSFDAWSAVEATKWGRREAAPWAECPPPPSKEAAPPWLEHLNRARAQLGIPARPKSQA